MKKSVLKTAVAAAIGASAIAAAPVAQAAVNNFDWEGVFTMLDAGGNPLANTSLSGKGVNRFQTPISGTMSFDTVSGAGTATLQSFDFFLNPPSLPAAAVGINMQAIGDGMGGPGTLVLGNMLFNWNGVNGIPVSLVLDAAGFFANELTQGGANSAIPASDGSYTGSGSNTNVGTSGNLTGTVNGPGGYAGYLSIGPVPIATTAYNTTNGVGCSAGVDANYSDNIGGGCIGVAASGLMPLVVDTATNVAYDYVPNTGGTIGGSPMQDGPFQGNSANFDVLTLTFTSQDPGGSIAPFCEFNIGCPPEIPVPAAVWLFGSGLLGLVGVARRKKSEV